MKNNDNAELCKQTELDTEICQEEDLLVNDNHNEGELNDAFYLPPGVKRKVSTLMEQYKYTKILANEPITQVNPFDIDLRSPSDYSETGFSKTNRISRPTEALILKNQGRNDQIRKARKQVELIDKGIREACRYARTGARKDIEIGLRRRLLEGKTYSYLFTASCVTTIKRYEKMAYFFTAYFFGLISEEDVEKRNIPKLSWYLSSEKSDDELEIWERPSTKDIERRTENARIREENRQKRIAKNKEKKLKRREEAEKRQAERAERAKRKKEENAKKKEDKA